MKDATTLDPGAYAGWRATPLGAITEGLELDLVFELAGPLEGRSVLDVGSGDGSYAIEAARRGAAVTAIDVDPSMLRAAEARAAALGLELRLVQGRVERLPFADQSFDLVFAVTVLCFVDDPNTAFLELARVLRPGGRAIVADLGRYNLWAASRRLRGWLGAPTWRAAHFWSRAELRRHLKAAGLEVTALHGAIHYPPSARAARLLAPLDPYLTRARAPGAAFLAASATKPLVTP